MKARARAETKAASMGPRLSRRGNEKVGFVLDANTEASMGPRLSRRGNFYSSSPKFRTRHRFNGAPPKQAGKRLADFRSAKCARCASMGPRLSRRGNSHIREVIELRFGKASMGPRLSRRGNNTESLPIDIGAGRFNGAPPKQAGKLSGNISYDSYLLCFNGAPPKQAGKQRHPARKGDRRRTASMGPRLSRRGNRPKCTRIRQPRRCFNGAPPKQAGKLVTEAQRKGESPTLQWGPA